jgi:hypothetical protein
VAQFKSTVLILPNGVTIVTGVPFNVDCYESEHSVTDEEMKTLLASELKLIGMKKSALAQIGAAPAGDKPAETQEGAQESAEKKKKKKKKKSKGNKENADEEAGDDDKEE